MKNPKTGEELEPVVRKELAQVGLIPDRLEIKSGDGIAWWLEIEIAKRRFTMGSIYRDGFFCEEIIEGRMIDFTSHEGQPIFGHADRLRLEALRLVRYAIDHPDFRGFVRPVI